MGGVAVAGGGGGGGGAGEHLTEAGDSGGVLESRLVISANA